MDSKNEKQTRVNFAERVRVNQRRLRSDLKSHYDFIVCGAGSSGSVVVRRMAENPDVNVLLLEAGGDDEVPCLTEASRWFENLGSEHDWNFVARPNPYLRGRSLPLNMGKVLGGGSSINVMNWARGHKHDRDCFAAESGDTAWNYQSVLEVYRRIEDWHGAPDPGRRGTGGLVFVHSAPDPNPIAPAMVEGAHSIGIPTFDSNNGRLMEGDGGASIVDQLVCDGKRLSIFRSYTFPYMDRPNLTVLTHALVIKLILEGTRTVGVEIALDGRTRCINAGLEGGLSLGAIQTPKVLMLSGIGDQAELQRLGIPVEIILGLAASGSIARRSLPATTDLRRHFFGRANLISMGRGLMSVVDAQLKVYGVEKLRVADASIMPRVTKGNIGIGSLKYARVENRVEALSLNLEQRGFASEEGNE
jgi:choline dehydrogenase